MSREITHPSRDLDFGEVARFNNFLQFILTPDISSNQQLQFIKLLEKLHSKTGDLWKPALCVASPTLFQEIGTLLPSYLPGSTQAIEHWPEYPGHYWNTITRHDIPKLIIDPVGLANMRNGNLPFFGSLAGVELSINADASSPFYLQGAPLDPSEMISMTQLQSRLNRLPNSRFL